MTIEMRAQRAGAGARRAAGEGMDLMTASAQLPQDFERRQQRRRTGIMAAVAGAVLVVGAAVVIPQLTDDPAPPASSVAETATAAGVTVVVPDGWSVDTEFSNPEFLVMWSDAATGAESGITMHGVSRIWDPVAKTFAPVPADFGAWLRANPSYRIRSEEPATVAGQPTTTFLAAAVTGWGDQVPLVETAMSGFNPADAEYPGAQGEVVDLNPGEESYFTTIVADGELVLISTAYAADLPGYQAVLASATTS